MKISAKGEYAMRAMMFLCARHDSNTVVQTEDIAENQGIPKKYLVQILLQLKAHGLVSSRRGAAGGYHLARAPREITVGDVLRAVEGPLMALPCTDELESEHCPLEDTCGLKSIWKGVRNKVADVLDGITFQEIREQEEQRQGAMYYI